MRNATLLSALLFSTACASGGASTAAPEVSVTQTSKVERLQMSVTGGLPVDYDLRVANSFTHPVTLTSVEIETVGLSGAYTMKRVRHAFAVTIPAHSAAVVPIRAWVHVLQETDLGDVNAPVTVRGVATFSGDGRAMKTAFAARVQ